MSGIIGGAGSKSGVIGTTELGTVTAGTLEDAVTYRGINQDLASTDSPTFAGATVNGLTVQNGMYTYTASFAVTLNVAYSWEITLGTYWKGFILIQCGVGYYPGTPYCCSLYGWYAVRMNDSSLSQLTNIATQISGSSNNAGYWTVEKVVASPESASTKIKINKVRGGTSPYGSGGQGTPGSTATGRGFIKVTYRLA